MQPFILLDLLGGARMFMNGANTQTSDRGNSATGIGTVYGGDMPPMQWIQREQQRSERTDVAASTEANSIREQGNRAFRSGDYNRAVELYSESIELDPRNDATFCNRALAYIKLQNNAAAIADSREALQLNPQNDKAHYRLGQALVAIGDFADALTHLKVALEHAASNEDRECIAIQIQKCEAKLARAAQIFTPTSPKKVIGSGAGTNGFGRPSGATTPLTCSAEPEVGHGATFGSTEPHTALAPKIQEQPSHVHLVPEAISGLLKGRLESLDTTAFDVLASVFEPSRVSRIKQLLGAANSDQLSKAVQLVDEAQETLRSACKEADRERYQSAVTARDSAMQKLWEVTEASSSAVAQLREMAWEEKRLMDSWKALRTKPDEEIIAACSSEAPPAIPSRSIHELLEQKAALEPFLAKLEEAKARTDAAAAQLMDAIRDEQRGITEGDAQLRQWLSVRDELQQHARYFAAKGHEESELGPSKIEALDALASTLNRVETDSQQFRRHGSLGPELLQQEADLERERLAQEKQRIHLQGEVEWMRVKDEPPSKIEFLVERLNNVRGRIANIAEKQSDVQRRILALIETDRPELSWKAAAGGSRMLKWVKGSGLWMNCGFSDFHIHSAVASTVNSKVYHASYKGEQVALKEVPMESDKARRRFQNEINITLGSANHPNIVKIIGVFFDGPFAYIVMPYLRRGSLKTLLSSGEPIPWFRVQEIFRQVVSAVTHLHDRGIVHADLKPSNILFTDNGVPVISDFGIAKDYGRYGERDMTLTTSLTGTADFMAPELLSGEGSRLPTSRSDIWSLGVTLFSVASANGYFHQLQQLRDRHQPAQITMGDDEDLRKPAFPMLLPGALRVNVNAKDVGGNDRLADMISQLLTVDPSTRASAIEALAHPYFATSLVEDLVNNKELVESNAKLEALKSYIHVLRAGMRNPTLVSVLRNHMVESVTNIFDRFNEPEIVKPIMVVFQGEQGVDEGALTTEMFSLYFKQLVTRQKLFVTSKGDGESDSSGAEASFDIGAEYTLSCDPRAPEKHLMALGKVLLKCIVENRPLPLQLNASVLKYLAGAADPTLLDLEAYDRTLAHNLKRLYLLSSDDLDEMCLDFSEFPEEFLQQSATGCSGDITRDTRVTVKNVRRYVLLKCKYELWGKREIALSAVKRGFLSSPLLSPHLRLLSATELMMLLCGQQHLHANTIIDSLDFQGFPSTSSTPSHLKDCLRVSGQNNLRRFLRLCTANVSIPHGGLPRKIKVLCTADVERFPVGHACVYQLDLPDYNDAAVLRAKLATALAHVNDGFHIA
jgi:serine/threonine protein kinase/tetratricopeptide (TPR) repeat protein